jgi:hypothetical protein
MPETFAPYRVEQGPGSFRLTESVAGADRTPRSSEIAMRKIILAVLLLGFTVSAHADDGKQPAGAAKGAAVGAVAGHEVGSGHAVAGAAAGAAIGHHQTKKAEQTKSE